MQTYRQYLRARIDHLRAEYPESTADDRRACLVGVEQEWINTVRRVSRETVVPLNVGRSLVALIGHAAASRALRHVANFPACLPRAAQTFDEMRNEVVDAMHGLLRGAV